MKNSIVVVCLFYAWFILSFKPLEFEGFKKEAGLNAFTLSPKNGQILPMLGWSAKRELSKINYRIHTDAIKHNLIPAQITPAQASLIYANEADVLNVAMFGMTAKQWRDLNPRKDG